MHSGFLLARGWWLPYLARSLRVWRRRGLAPQAVLQGRSLYCRKGITKHRKEPALQAVLQGEGLYCKKVMARHRRGLALQEGYGKVQERACTASCKAQRVCSLCIRFLIGRLSLAVQVRPALSACRMQGPFSAGSPGAFYSIMEQRLMPAGIFRLKSALGLGRAECHWKCCALRA
eukprot:1139624-Pelagomonas_calceolata.AAC.3